MANYQSSYTGAQIDTAIAKINNLVDYVYPVGAIYISVNSTSPATLFGGTWEQINEKFLLAGSSTNYPYGNIGGNATHVHTTAGHTLTESEMPSHYHYLSYDGNNAPHAWAWGAYSGSDSVHFSSSNATTAASTGNRVYTRQNTWNTTQPKGGGGSHSHGNTGSASTMPPYLSVYMWKRTA